ncbi:unnamed protein product [Hymenolepis diminuta]|uniref:RBR-type E3 ubiquitin transferase n=1 Tax=Hymenolepis diminuta TaxID=6216 RepID=A0A0R3SA96_HYMDI|nr:unnamed protein product [Hymenolepis diminuta]VUZ47720.1 unnamed protein product [Hymenolepis diminuta]
MTDLIQQLANKPPCLSSDSRRRQNTKLVLDEIITLSELYNDHFKLNDPEDPGEFFIEVHQNFTIFLTGPPIRRNLKYSEICSFDSSLNQMTYNLTVLPPIICRFQLGQNYPSKPDITFWFDSAWLSPHFFDLLSLLLSEEIKSQPRTSLTHCCKFLREKALSGLFSIGDPNILVINSADIYEDAVERVQFVELLVDFEEEMREREFALLTFECDICMEEFKGKDCARLRACGHIFCKQCIAKSIEEDIETGRNSCSPGCPGCDKLVHPVEIRHIVSPEVYERYETMLLNRTLADMPNVVECPAEGCDSPVMLDDNFTEGICTICRFHFCAKCHQAFHPDTACVAGPLANLTPDEARDLVERYNNAGEQGQEMMEKQYGRLNILKLIDEVASNSFIFSNCKPCPNCKSPIQKYAGCNRVLCTKCKKNFCWLCLVVIESSDPYSHFNGNCQLYQ